MRRTISLALVVLSVIGVAPVLAFAADSETRLFFGPTGRTLKQGEGYVTADELFLPHVQFGVTDRFSMGAGTSAIFSSDFRPPVWFTPKFKIHDDGRTAVAVGAIHAMVAGDQFGLAYVVATTGSSDRAFTIGAGWGYPGRSGGGAPVIITGGEWRVSRRMTLVNEDYFAARGGTALVGIRVTDRRYPRLSSDVGLVMPIAMGRFIPAPVFNITWRFGR
jgi:hypothetical protein